MTEPDKHVLDKIRSPLRKAEEGSGATEAERDNAIAAAQRLMRRYRLEEHEIGKDDPNVSHAVGRVLGWFTFSEYWQVRLIEALGDTAVTLQVVWYPRTAKSMVQVIGTEVAIDYAAMILEWVKPQLLRECETACWNERRLHNALHLLGSEPRPWHAGDSIRFRRSFYEGAVSRIRSRFREWANQEPVGQAIILSDRARIDEWLKSRGMSLVSYGSSAPLHSGAWNDGTQAGGRVDLRPGNKVPGSGTRQLESGG